MDQSIENAAETMSPEQLEQAANDRTRSTLRDILRSVEKGKDYAASRQKLATLQAVCDILLAKWKSSEKEPAEVLRVALGVIGDRDKLIKLLIDPAVEFGADLVFAVETKHQSPLKGGRTPRDFVSRFICTKVAPASKTGEMTELLSQIVAALG